MSHRSVTLATVRQSADRLRLQFAKCYVPHANASNCIQLRLFTGGLNMPLLSRDDPGVVTHDSCLIPNPPLVPFLQHADDSVGIGDTNDGASREIKIQIAAIYRREESRLARTRCCLRFGRAVSSCLSCLCAISIPVL